MSKHNIPFFEVNGKKYEIRRNRYLQAELDEMKGELLLNEDEQVAFAKEQEFSERIDKLRARKEELYDKYLQTFDAADEEMHLKACAAYDKLIEEAAHIESVSGKQQQKMVDIGEQLIIKSLQIDNEGKTIRTAEEANEIWSDFVDEFGKANSLEFVIYTINYIVGGDDDMENPFIAQAKAKAEQKANMRKGIVKVR